MGLIKALFKMKAYILLFGAGYLVHGCVNSDEKYKIKRVEDAPYLVDKERDEKLRIYEGNFQVGSIEHRIKGLLAERNLVRSLKNLEKKLEVEK